MNNALTVDVELAGHRASRWSAAILSAVALVAIVFVVVAALPYFNPAAGQWARYSSRRWWLLVHISTGIVALLTDEDALPNLWEARRRGDDRPASAG